MASVRSIPPVNLKTWLQFIQDETGVVEQVNYLFARVTIYPSNGLSRAEKGDVKT